MTRPPNYEDAMERGLLAKDGEGIHTFSNGTEGYGWMDHQCFECAYYPPDGPAGEYCALESALLLGQVSPELARLFGFEQLEPKWGPRDGWRMGAQSCRFFKQREDRDDGEYVPPPPPPDPDQLVLLADPTEDAATIQNAPVEVAVRETVNAVSERVHGEGGDTCSFCEHPASEHRKEWPLTCSHRDEKGPQGVCGCAVQVGATQTVEPETPRSGGRE